MAGNVLVDTNVAIALFEGDRAALRRRRTAEQVHVPSIVIGELIYGAMKSAQPQQNLEKIEDLARATVILACDAETARRYGEIKAQLHKTGQLIPDNDLWIPALAVQHGLSLVTRDKHFERIKDLQVESW